MVLICLLGGGGGIRTHECLRTHAFQACGIDRYPTPPYKVDRNTANYTRATATQIDNPYLGFSMDIAL
jgi:hypothetical protein